MGTRNRPVNQAPRLACEELECLVAEARMGNQNAMAALLVADMPQLTRWVHGRLPSSVRGHLDTTELSQEVALLAVRALPRFRPRHACSMPAFTRRIATNRLLDEHRRRQRRPVAVNLDDNLAALGPSPEEAVIAGERAATCRAALAQLRPRDRQLLKARHFDGLDMAAIARHLGIRTSAAAGVAVRRAEARFRCVLDGMAPCRKRPILGAHPKPAA